MLPGLVPVAAAQCGAFTAPQSYAAGYSDDEVRARVRAGRWVALRRGVYATREEVEQVADGEARHRLLAAAGLLALEPGAVLSHISAATLHRVDLRTSPGLVVHATRPEGPPRAYRALRVHQLPLAPAEVAAVGALSVTAPARTVVDCAQQLPFADAVVIADSALAQGVVGEAALREASAQALPRHARRVDRVVSFADGRSESAGESFARVVMVEQGLPTPDLQVDLHDAAGLIGRVDFLWRAERVVGEFDGQLKYRTDPAALWREKLREDRLREAGYEVARFTWADLTDHPEAVGERVRAACARSQTRQTASPPRAAGWLWRPGG